MRRATDQAEVDGRAAARRLSGALLLLALTLAVYLPSLGGGFIWDDDAYVTNNLTLRSLTGLGQIWFEIGAIPQYYPLVFSSFWVEYHLWGLNPAGYHLVNILLHALGAVLLWRVLARLNLPGAWFAAAIFAVHPVHVESVAWITERKNVLSGCFYLASLQLCLSWAGLAGERAADRGEPRAGSPLMADSRRQRLLYLGSLVLFVCALLSKTVTFSLPATLLVILWWKRGRVGRGPIQALAPFFSVGLAAGLLTAWMEVHHVGARGTEWSLTLVERGLVAGRALWFYATKLIWPHPLTFIYPRWSVNTGSWWQYLFPAAALGLVLVLFLLRRRTGRGPLAALLFFVGTLSPALGFFNVYPMRYSFVADHFQYLGSIGLIALGTAALARLFEGLGPELRRAGLAVGLTVLAGLGLLTWRQSAGYTDRETLWRHTLSRNPGAWMAHNNLGNELSRQERYLEALPHYRRSLRLKPDDEKAHNNLGLALVKLGTPDEALPHFEAALRLDPEMAEAHFNLGEALVQLGRSEEALASIREALRLNPRDHEARHRLADLLLGLEQPAEAAALYRELLTHRPEDPELHFRLGTALTRLGRREEAAASLEEAMRLDPTHQTARTTLAELQLELGRGGEAISYYRRLLTENPDDPAAHNNLGVALAGQGETAEAVRHYREALAINPGFTDARINLGNIMAAQGELAEAARQYGAALQWDPTLADAHNNLGYVRALEGRLEAAMTHYREALRLRPRFTSALNNLGNALAARGELEPAVSCFEEALETEADNSDAHYNLAMALARLGRYGEAVNHLETVVGLRPDDAQARQRLAQLQGLLADRQSD